MADNFRWKDWWAYYKTLMTRKQKARLMKEHPNSPLLRFGGTPTTDQQGNSKDEKGTFAEWLASKSSDVVAEVMEDAPFGVLVQYIHLMKHKHAEQFLQAYQGAERVKLAAAWNKAHPA